MTKIAGVYRIKSVIKPERYYIGSSCDIATRWSGHRSDLIKGKHHSRKLQRHFNKYGMADLAFEIIEESTFPDKDYLLYREQCYLDKNFPYFNNETIAGSPKGRKASPEARAKMSATRKGRKRSPESIQKWRDAVTGKKRGPQTKEQRDATSKMMRGNTYSRGRKASPEARAKMSAAHRGKHHSEEWNRHISEGNRGKKLSEEVRRKISKSKKGKGGWKVSPETKRRMSEAAKRLWAARKLKKQAA